MLAFGIAGGAGFVVDAIVLHILVRQAGVSPFVARVPSFLAAVCVTWWINRSFAFRAEREAASLSHGSEYLRYLGVQATGALINYGVYAAALVMHPAWRAAPVWALALGSAVAMAFNYTGCRSLVYAPSAAARVDGS
jgi:putative flippase GtrA